MFVSLIYTVLFSCNFAVIRSTAMVSCLACYSGLPFNLTFSLRSGDLCISDCDVDSANPVSTHTDPVHQNPISMLNPQTSEDDYG